MDPKIKAAAASLNEIMLTTRRDYGVVGIGADRLYLFMFAKKKEWLAQIPTKHDGYPVEVHWTGRPVALARS